MNDFHNELNRVLRYSMNNAENLLAQLAGPEHNHTRWADGSGDHTFRMVTAGALEDDDRHTEAGLLADPNQHVIVHEGKVRPARFTDRHIIDAGNATADHIREWSGGEAGINYPNWEECHGTCPAYWDDEHELEDLTDEQKHEMYPKGTLRLHHNYHDDHTENYSHPVHYTELGDHLADHIDNEVARDWIAWPEHQEGTERENEFIELLSSIRNAPVEEVDTDHHTEQGGGRG